MSSIALTKREKNGDVAFSMTRGKEGHIASKSRKRQWESALRSKNEAKLKLASRRIPSPDQGLEESYCKLEESYCYLTKTNETCEN